MLSRIPQDCSSLQVNLDLGAVVLHPLPDSLKPDEAEDENDGEDDIVQAEQEDGPLPLTLKSTIFWHLSDSALQGDHGGLRLNSVDFNLGVLPVCPLAMPFLPNFHLPKQIWADCQQNLCQSTMATQGWDSMAAQII